MISDHNFLRADAHSESPPLSAANYDFEEKLIPEELRGVRHALQVGCMNGTRVVRFSQAAPWAHIDGLELSEASVENARENVRAAELDSIIFHGDITAPPPELLARSYDFVYALNNTLGYIPDAAAALRHMRALSIGKVGLSLFSNERFTNDITLPYFASMDIDPHMIEVEGDIFYIPGVEDAYTPIRRFDREEVLSWGGRIRDTPLGFYAVFSANSFKK